MNWLSRLIGGGGYRGRAARLAHDALVAQARHPAFYTRGAAEDTLDGRFAMSTLHAALLMRRLKALGPEGRALSQAVFDALFSGLDHALRETGTGDLRVGRKMRVYGEVFYGQAKALDAALDAPEPLAALLSYVERNSPAPDEKVRAWLAGYALEAARQLDGQAEAALLSGRVAFPDPSGLT